MPPAKPMKLQAEDQHSHQSNPKAGCGGEDNGEGGSRIVHRCVLLHRRQYSNSYTGQNRDNTAGKTKLDCDANTGENHVAYRPLAVIGRTQIQFGNDTHYIVNVLFYVGLI